jgi:hypothetical protein
MPQPIPKPDARKQRHAVAENQSSHRVPTSGRVGRPPKVPFALGEAGARWWRWAWSTPQATKWHKGFHEPLARRASLEDVYDAAVADGDRQGASRLLAAMYRVDDSFGLTPMGAAKQHIVFVDDEPSTAKAGNGASDNVTPIRNRLKGMREG